VGPAVFEIALRTLAVSGLATLLSIGIGVPVAYGLATRRFVGRTLLVSLANAGMGLPPVLVGLVVWLLLVRSGPLGGLEIVYTKRAMVVAQCVIGLPVVIGFSTSAFQALAPELTDLLRMMGVGRVRRILLLAREAKLGLLAAIMATFGAAISEVGASMMVGGNLRGSTRVLTTAIVTETSRGESNRALALGAVLLGLTIALSLALTWLQQRARP
jgi:tungstate transport system permease protein